MFKNIIIAALATVIYHANIVPGITLEKKIFAIVCAFVFVVVVMDSFDSMIKNARRRKVHMLSRKAFRNYKRWIKEDILPKKAKGKDETYRKNLIINVIAHQKKYAFSGKQISELLDLAVAE